MRDIADLEVTQIYLYAAGQIPHKHIQTGNSVDQIRERFGFRGVMPAGSELLFEGGVIEVPKHGKVPLTRLQLSDRRIVLSVAANSAVAADAFGVIRSMISQMDPGSNFDKAKPITFREETGCVVTLDIDWEGFFNPAVVRFLQGPVTEALSDEEATVSIAHAKYRFTFSYSVKSQAIPQSGIILAPKDFVVEPLANVPLSERRYLTGSPTDSETHLKLVQQLESVLLGAKQKVG